MAGPIHLELLTHLFNKIGQERRFRDVGYRSVHHPIADMRADIAGRRFVP